MIRRWLRRAAFALLALLILLALPALYIHGWCRGGTGAETAPSASLPPAMAEGMRAAAGYRRAEARSLLTYPEWYVVFTSQDYAGYIARKRPSGFRYFASAFAFWTSYCDINRYTTPRYAFDSEVHIVNYVIGISHTVELVLKGLYETIVGRLSELFGPGASTAEERFAQAVFADYGNFLRTTPWYEYPFAKRRQELALVDTAGPGQIRKWERRIALSAELAVKSVYAGMIRGGTQSAFEAPKLTTVAVVGAPRRREGDPDARAGGPAEPAGLSALRPVRRSRPGSGGFRRRVRRDRRQQRDPGHRDPGPSGRRAAGRDAGDLPRRPAVGRGRQPRRDGRAGRRADARDPRSPQDGRPGGAYL
jgi:hypothetical protein